MKRFFGVRGRDYDSLFGMHELSHKALPGTDRVAFDGLVLDGAANYVKLVGDGNGWEVADVKARSYSTAAKQLLAAWLVRVCSEDCYDGPPPFVESTGLLNFRDALAACRRALRRTGRAVVPLGGARRSVQAYKLIKPSQFVYRTAHQKRRIEREWSKLVEGTACGPEILSLRKTYAGSLAGVAGAVYELIRSGADRLVGLNVARFLRAWTGAGPRQKAVAARRAAAAAEFLDSLDAAGLSEGEPATGLALTSAELERVMISRSVE